VQTAYEEKVNYAVIVVIFLAVVGVVYFVEYTTVTVETTT